LDRFGATQAILPREQTLFERTIGNQGNIQFAAGIEHTIGLGLAMKEAIVDLI
jgi:hypothetical protein